MSTKTPERVYVDQRIFSDAHKDTMTWAMPWFFDEVRRGMWTVVVATPLLATQHFLDLQLPPQSVESIDPALGMPVLRAYLDAGIVTAADADAALQVALATVAGCTVLISWDTRAIANHLQVPRYHAVNQTLGYPAPALHLPPAILHYDDAHDVPSEAVQMKRRVAEQRYRRAGQRS